MLIKYTSHFLHKLEDLFAESNYHLRYEKGNFKSGYCILKESNIVMVNTYYPLEGKVNCLVEIIRELDFSNAKFSEKALKFYTELKQAELAGPEKLKSTEGAAQGEIFTDPSEA
jgi:hypothetical protein